MVDLKIPDGYARLTHQQFDATFGEIAKQLIFHVAAATGRTRQSQRAGVNQLERVQGILRRMERDGKLVFAKAPNGDPAVFAAHRKCLTSEEVPFANATVSYFDSTGSFNQETGEIEDVEAQLRLAEVVIGDRAKELQQQHAFLSTFDAADRTAFAIFAREIGTEHPQALIDLYVEAHEKAPTAAITPERFIKTAALQYAKHLQEAEHDPPADEQRTHRFRRQIAGAYNSSLCARVLALRESFGQHRLATGLSFGEQTALAFLANHFGMDADKLLDAFVFWRTGHPDVDGDQFFADFVQDPTQRAVISEEYAWFREYVQEQTALDPEQVKAFATGVMDDAVARLAAAKQLRLELEAVVAATDPAQLLPTKRAAAREQLQQARQHAIAGQQQLEAFQSFVEQASAPHNLDDFTRLVVEAQKRSVTPQGVVNDWVRMALVTPDLTLQQFLQVVSSMPQPGDPVYKMPDVTLDEWIAEEYPDAVQRLSTACNISRRVVREILDRWVHAGVIHFIRVPLTTKPGKTQNRISGVLPQGWPELIDASRSERLVREEFARQFKVIDPQTMRELIALGMLPPREDATTFGPAGVTDLIESKLKTLASGGVPPSSPRRDRPGEHTYMRAIEAQYATLTGMLQLSHAVSQKGAIALDTVFADMTAEELFATDIAALKRADTFCWLQEPTLAVQAAAASLPDSIRLTRDLTEHYASWWYFTLPVEVQTTDTNDVVQALLWTWLDNALYMSVYVSDAKQVELIGSHALVPSSKFSWTEGETLAHAVQRIRAEAEERRAYWGKPGSLLPASTMDHQPFGDMTVEETVSAIERLLRFFVAGCLWIQQTILVQHKGHIERHARKRLERSDAFNRPLSDVQIIQLRRKEMLTPEKSDKPKMVDWQCRWVVKGFWRNQFYPSKGHYQPKWIDPFVKGPSDKPLKVAQHRVYAVSR